MNCIKCKDKFSYKERLKSVFQYKGKITCKTCKNSFIKKKCYIFVDLFVYIVMNIFIGAFIIPILDNKFNNSLLELLLTFIILVASIHIYGLITQNFWQYELYNKDFKK